MHINGVIPNKSLSLKQVSVTKIPLVGILYLLLSQVQAQYEWFNEYVGSSYVTVSKLGSDPNGNIFTVGNFEQTVNIENRIYQDGGAFLTKLTKSGQVVWVKRFTYSSLDFFSLTKVECDGFGNVYIAGQYPQSANIGGVTITGNMLNSFLAKFDNDGTLLWIKTFIGLQEIFDLSVNSFGNIGISGIFYAPFLTIDSQTLTSSKSFNSFGAYFNSNGTLQWAQTFSSHLSFNDFPVAIKIDDNGNYFMQHRFSKNITVGIDELISSGDYNLFVIKLNQQGKLLWHKEIERIAPFTLGVTELGDLTVDDSGNLYACGTFWQNFAVENINIVANSGLSQTSHRFVAKFSGLDGTIQWMKPTFGEIDGYYTENLVVAEENLYLSGLKEGNPYFQTLKVADGEPGSKYKVFDFRGDIANGLVVDSEGMIYMSGRRRISELAGYVFKVNTIGEVSSESETCYNNTLTATATPIPKASQYEWEISYNGIIILIETSEPLLELPLPTLTGVTDALSIRVRGKNNQLLTPYTATKKIRILRAPDPPILTNNCDKIDLLTGSNVTWFTSQRGLENFPENTTSIQAEQGLLYYVTTTNLCGEAKSNEIKFQPFFIPNIITPNDDDKNETLRLDERIDNSAVSIFDRWGKKVFESSSYQNNWAAEGLSTGIYFMSIQHSCFENGYKSTLSIVR
jgi:gliding motility-associated-like protein